MIAIAALMNKFLAPKANRLRRKHRSLPALLLLLLCTSGCFQSDPLAKHSMLTTFFDGVPDLPSLYELCQENMADLFNKYYEERIKESTLGGSEGDKPASGESDRSEHRPWKEKNCKACHDFKAESKLLTSRKEICYLCHKNFIQGTFVHGPVAVSACLVCHDPHSSANPSLLRLPLKEICFKCHREDRLAAKMHEKVISRGILCVECHDPHSRNIRYFLK